MRNNKSTLSGLSMFIWTCGRITQFGTVLHQPHWRTETNVADMYQVLLSLQESACSCNSPFSLNQGRHQCNYIPWNACTLIERPPFSCYAQIRHVGARDDMEGRGWPASTAPFNLKILHPSDIKCCGVICFYQISGSTSSITCLGNNLSIGFVCMFHSTPQQSILRGSGTTHWS